MGSIHKRQRTRADGTTYHVWQAITRLPNGKQTAKTERRKVDAERWLKETEANALKGTAVPTKRGRTPYGELLDRWVRAQRHDGRRESSKARDASYLKNHVRPRWEDWQLVAIERGDVQEWVNELTDAGLAPATVRKVYNLFSASLEWAVGERYLGVSPCPPPRARQRIALPTVGETKMRVLQKHEVGRLADAIDPRYRALVLVLGFAGLRIGEAAALGREDVNVAKRQVRVERTTSWVGGECFINEPKTSKGKRTVPLTPKVARALADHLARLETGEGFPLPEGRERQPYQRLSFGPEAVASGLVFPSPEGGYLQTTQFRARSFAPAVKEAKLEPLRIHDLRHTAVSLWIAAGVRADDAQRWAGHYSAAFTLDRYVQSYEGSSVAQLEALDELAEDDGTVVSIR